MYDVLTSCPVCQKNLTITRLECKGCGTTIENDFKLSKLASLSKEQLGFVEVFLTCRGNIKEVEKELNISYPTVRGKLDDVVMALGGVPAKDTKEKEKEKKKSLIDLLEKGDISVDEAIEQMKK